jgi:hypothetical protein
MESDEFQELIKNRISLIDSHKKNNYKEDLADIYPDKAHFIYELLQNAEDAQATEISFILSNDKLEVIHNGKPFIFKDIDAITTKGNSTKNNGNSVGKFGVGFKSVFIYTTTPQIHSGPWHIEIKEHYLPKKNPPYEKAEEKTYFCFPFNNSNKPSPKAVEEITNGLKCLNENSLLFLTNIKTISFKYSDDSEGLLQLTEKENSHHISIEKTSNSENITSDFLKYTKEINIEIEGKESGKVQKTFTTAIAYALEKDEKEEDVKIKKTSGAVSIFFPAVKETSNLNFHIHAPFSSTVSRDSLKDSEENEKLIKCISNCAAESLEDIKKQGLLTKEFLQILPLTEENFKDKIYEPIYKKVKEVITTKEFIIADDGTYISAENAVTTSDSKLKGLLDEKQLSALFGNTEGEEGTKKWTNIEPTSELGKYLKIESLDVQTFIQKSTENNSAFLSNQDDKWLIKFYAYLNEKNYPSFKEKAIVKLENSFFRSAYYSLLDNDKPSKNIFYSKDKEFVEQNNSIMLNLSLWKLITNQNEEDTEEWKKTKENAKKFLTSKERLHISEYGEIEQIIKEVLPLYTDKDNLPTVEGNKKHLDRILKAYNEAKENSKKNKLITTLKNTAFIRCDDNLTEEKNTSPIYQKPTELYFPTDDLKAYFGEGKGYFIHSDYTEDKVKELFHELEVSNLPRKINLCISCISKNDSGQFKFDEKFPVNFEKECEDEWKKVEKKHGKMRELTTYDLEGLEEFFNFNNNKNNVEKIIRALLLWNILSSLDDASFWNSEYRYKDGRKRDDAKHKEKNIILKRLKNECWLPNKDGELKKISEIKPNELHHDFSDPELIHSLGIPTIDEKLLEDAGYAPKVLETAKKLHDSGKTPKEIDDFINSPQKTKSQKASFPKSASSGENRENKMAEGYFQSPTKSYEKQSRSTRTSIESSQDSKIYLKENYTNEDHQLICQICKEEMPFKKSDEEYYFESVEMFLKEIIKKEAEYPYLALCPICAAKYKTFVKTHNTQQEEIKKAILQGDPSVEKDREIQIKLDSETKEPTIHFVEKHFSDVQTILKCESQITNL